MNVCPFCGGAQPPGAVPCWLFRRHARPHPGVGICPGSASLLPVPNLWTELTRLYQLQKDPTVDITISREAIVAHLSPGDIVAHPDTGRPWHLVRMSISTGAEVVLTGHPENAPTRTARLKVDRGDEIAVLPTAEQAADVWRSIAQAVGKAVCYWDGVDNPDVKARTAAQDMEAAPWALVPGQPPALDIRAAGHIWHVAPAAMPVAAQPEPEPAPEPAEV